MNPLTPPLALGLPGALALVIGLSLVVGCLAGTLIHAGAGDGGPAPAEPGRRRSAWRDEP